VWRKPPLIISDANYNGDAFTRVASSSEKGQRIGLDSWSTQSRCAGLGQTFAPKPFQVPFPTLEPRGALCAPKPCQVPFPTVLTRAGVSKLVPAQLHKRAAVPAQAAGLSPHGLLREARLSCRRPHHSVALAPAAGQSEWTQCPRCGLHIPSLCSSHL